MTNQNKTEIKAKLGQYVAKYDSQNKAANSLRGVSAATISQILNDNWDKISDEMWRNIAAQIGARQWVTVETSFYRLFTELIEDARLNSFVYAITTEAGSGKSFAISTYASTHRNVYHIVCCEMWSLQAFLFEILRTLGLEQKTLQNNNVAMLAEIVAALKKMDCPVLIFDEADKLRQPLLYSLITLYNQLEDYCGIILCATSHLETKIVSGVRLGKLGFNELYSRVGRKFIQIPSCRRDDINAICKANGIDNQDEQAEVFNGCDSDLRRVKRMIHAIKKRN